MKSDDEIIELIEAWFEKRLSPKDLKAFEDLIKTDPRVASLIEKYKLANHAIQVLKEENMNNLVKSWQSNLGHIPKIEENKNKNSWWFIFLGVLFIITIIFIFFLKIKLSGISTDNYVTPNDTLSIQQFDILDSTHKQDTLHLPEKAITTTRVPINEIALNYLNSFQDDVQNKYGVKMGTNSATILEQAAYAAMDKKYVKVDSLITSLDSQSIGFAVAQEIQALVNLQQKKYSDAIESYRYYSTKVPSPLADLRMIQFYLLDYQSYKKDIWIKLDEMTDPNAPHLYRDNAEKIKDQLVKRGYMRN